MAFYELAFAEWQAKGVDRHSLVADPKFVDAGKYDFRLQPDSPALALGFQPIDMSQNGLLGEPDWVALPKRSQFAKTILPPPPPEAQPVVVDDGFEDTPVGGLPKLATVLGEEKGASIRVTDEAAASGQHSLKFTDAPGLAHFWDPHMYYIPRFKEGRADLAFDLRVEPGAIVAHEWRDNKAPYTVGPSLRVNEDGQLVANGTPLAKVTFGQWVGVEIHCGLGSKANGRYDLVMTPPGGQPMEFRQIPCGSPTFNRLDWLGFISLAKDKATFYLDNVQLDLPDR